MLVFASIGEEDWIYIKQTHLDTLQSPIHGAFVDENGLMMIKHYRDHRQTFVILDLMPYVVRLSEQIQVGTV